MKKSEIKIQVKLGDIFDAPLMDAWDMFCKKYGINEWCLNEGLAEKKDTVQISLEDAEYYGLIENERNLL